MPKLLTIDRKLRTLSRRIVTDAGGAPCCCQPDEACPCDPSLQFRPFSIQTCQDNRRGAVVLSPAARIAIVRFEWSIVWDEYAESFRGFPTFQAVAQRGLSRGIAQWCVIHAGGGSAAQWIFSGATSVFEYQAAAVRSRQSLPDDQSLNLVGAEAFDFPISTPGIRRNYRDTWATYVPDRFLGWIGNMPRPFRPIGIDPQDGTLCNGVQTYSDRFVRGERFEFAYAAGVDGGGAVRRYTLDYQGQPPDNTIRRNNWSIEAAWTNRYLTCELGGPDQLQREPGCSNCGDRAALEPFA